MEKDPPTSHVKYDPQPSAAVIGASAVFMVKLAHEKRAIPKGKVRQYEVEAEELKLEGIRAAAYFRGGIAALTIAPELLASIGPSPLPGNALSLLKEFHLTLYLQQRTNLAVRVQSLWEKLNRMARPAKSRGRPRGSLANPKIDGEIHSQALKRWISTANLDQKASHGHCLRAVVKEYLRDGRLLPKGDEGPNNSLAGHMKRLKAQIPPGLSGLRLEK